MKRQKLIQLLEAYEPVHPEERLYKEEILSFIKRREDCFERFLEEGHVTASAWLVNKKGDSALLMHHAKLDIWCQLGGHADGDPDVLAVALKEAREESGIDAIEPIGRGIFDIDVHEIPETRKEKAHKHYDIRFLLQAVGSEEVLCNEEAKALLWVSKEKNALPTKERSILRMHEKWVQQGSALLDLF